MSLPAPDPRPLDGRGLCLVHAPADRAALAPLIGLLRTSKLKLRVCAPDADGWLAGVAEPIDGAPVERVVLWWSAAAAALPRVERLRGETASLTGDRLALLPLDDTPIPPMLAGGHAPLLDRCLRALAEQPVDSAPAAVVLKRATLDRIRRLGAIALTISALLVAAVLVFWRFPSPRADETDRLVLRVVLLIMMPGVAGFFAMLWARLDRRFLAHRAGSYLIDRALEER